MVRNFSFIGLVAGIITIILWFIMNFFNPYSMVTENDTIMITLIMLVLPACTAIISFFTSRKLLMLIAFVWSLPFSLYMLMTPSIFLAFGFTCLSYLLSFILMCGTIKK